MRVSILLEIQQKPAHNFCEPATVSDSQELGLIEANESFETGQFFVGVNAFCRLRIN